MGDNDYPESWKPLPERTIPKNDPGVDFSTLHSGCPAEPGRYAPQPPYPDRWRL